MNCSLRRTVVLTVAVATLFGGAAQAQSVPAEWKSLGIQGLTDLAQEFRAKGNAGDEDCQRLAAYVSERYAAAKAGGSVDWNEWLDLVVVLGRKFPADVKTTVRQDLQVALAPDQAAVVALPAETLLELGPAFSKVGAVAKACDVIVTWIAGSEKHRGLDHAQTDRLTCVFRGASEERKEGRLRLIRFLTDTYLADSEKPRRLTCAQWEEFTWLLGRDLSEEARRGWADRIRQAYAGTTDQLLQLDGDRFILLARALWSHLGDEKTDELAARWLENTENWRPLKDAQSLKLLADLTGRAGQAGKVARTRLAEHATETCLSDPEAVRSAAPGDWTGLAASLSEDLSAQARARWVTGLRSAFVEDAEFFGSVSLKNVQGLSSVLNALGDKRAHGVVLEWFGKTEAWQSLKPRELASLAGSLSRCGEAGQAAKGQVAEHVRTTYLASAAATRSVNPGDWGALVGRLARDLSAEVRAAWLTGLRSAYVEDAATFTALKAAQCRSLAGALRTLGDEHTANVAVAWLEQHEPSGMVTPGESVSLVAMAIHADAKTAGPLTEAFDETWLAADSREPLALGTVSKIVSCWLSARNYEKAKAWLMRAYSSRLGTEAARESVSVGELRALSTLLEDMWLTGKGKGYPAFAAALAAHVRKGTLDLRGRSAYTPPRNLARPLGTSEARQVLENELLDARGDPRLDVAKVLAWAYRDVEELETWCTLVDAKVAGTAGDTKALWLMVKGYTDTLATQTPDPRRELYWLKTALAAADSEPVRLTALSKLVGYYRDTGRHATAVDLLESVKGQFADAGVGRVEALQEQVQRERAERLAREAREQTAAKLAAKQKRLRYYRACLEQARKEQDQAAIGRLETAIQQLEGELNP